MDLKLADRVVLIAGGGGVEGSIGHAIALTFAVEQCRIAIMDIDPKAEFQVSKLKERGARVLFLQADATRESEVKSAMQKLIDHYGELDVLVNNIGVNDNVDLDGEVGDFERSLQLNLSSYFLVTKYAKPHLAANKGNIVNIGSKVAVTGQGKTSGYVAAKGGVLALTREWAINMLKEGVRVNAVIPAECWTPGYDAWIKSIEGGQEKLDKINSTIPLGHRMTTPEEIANMVVFLASGRSSHTTGQHIFVDGGYTHLDRGLMGI